MKTGNPVRVLGWSVVTPLGGPERGAYLDALLKGKRFTGTTPGIIPEWDPHRYSDSRQLRRMSRISALSLVAATGALENAGLHLDPKTPSPDLAVIFSSTHGASGYLREFHEGFLRDGPLGASPILFTNGVSNAPAGHISLEFGIRGRCFTIIGDALSSFEGLCEGASLLDDGARAVIVGAAEEWSAIVQESYERFTGQDLPSQKALPRQVALYEGAAVLVLAGGEGKGDILHPPSIVPPGSKAPDPRHAIEASIENALENAGLDKEDPDVLVTSLQGREADVGEEAGLARWFSGRKRELPIVAPAANLGEGFAFTALLGVATSLAILGKGRIPPYVGERRPGLPAPFVLSDVAYRREVRLALVVCRSADGSAGALVVRKNGFVVE